MSGWIAMHRGEDADLLQERHPAAFLLLCQTARRARWRKDRCTITGLGFGQAMLGDWKSAGLDSEKSYRHAKSVLQRAGLVTFRGANRGTVATIISQRIFSIETCPMGEQGGTPTDDLTGSVKGTRRDRQGATKNKDTPNKGTQEADAAPTAPAENSASDAERLVAAYAKPSLERAALEAAADALRRFAGHYTFDQILSAVRDVTATVREWPEDERLIYLPTAANFFKDDLWRRHPTDWQSRRDAKKRLATTNGKPVLTDAERRARVGGRA